MNLMSSIEFGKTLKDVSDSEYRRLRDNFDNLLLQPLQLGFFVPCDLEGNVLEEPKKMTPSCGCSGICNNPCDEALNIEKYQEAKERCLFEGFEKSRVTGFDFAIGVCLFRLIDHRNIESLLNNKHKICLTLTQTALKQIGITDKK